MLKALKRNYWWVIAAVTLVLALIYGGAYNNFTAYHMIPVSEELGCSRTDFSTVYSVRAVVCVFSALLSGVIMRHGSYRKLASIGFVFIAASFAMMASAKNYPVLLIGCALAGIPDGICYMAGISRLLNRWFDKHRGLVLGAVTAATGIGSTLLGYVQSWAIDTHSWRLSFMIVSGLFLSLAVLVVLFIRDDPADMGLKPCGAGETVQKKQAKEKETAVRWEGFSMEYLRRRPVFYMMLLCTFLTCACLLLVSLNIVPFLQDCGMEAAAARRIYGYMMLFLGVIKLGMGALCDRIGSKKAIQLCHITCAAGVLMLLLLPREEWIMTGALLVFAVAMPVTTMMFPLLSVELFGYRAQNRYIGVIMAMVSASSVLASPIANTVYDLTGSYTPIFWVSVCVELSLVAVYGLLFWLARREKLLAEKLPVGEK